MGEMFETLTWPQAAVVIAVILGILIPWDKLGK